MDMILGRGKPFVASNCGDGNMKSLGDLRIALSFLKGRHNSLAKVCRIGTHIFQSMQDQCQMNLL